MKLDPSMIIGGLLVLLYGLVLFRLIARRVFARRKTVWAEVVGKQPVEQFSKYSGSGKTVKYAVTFRIDGKNQSFYVSEFSYGGYRVGEKGQLTYQGNRLIDFQ